MPVSPRSNDHCETIIAPRLSTPCKLQYSTLIEGALSSLDNHGVDVCFESFVIAEKGNTSRVDVDVG